MTALAPTPTWRPKPLEIPGRELDISAGIDRRTAVEFGATTNRPRVACNDRGHGLKEYALKQDQPTSGDKSVARIPLRTRDGSIRAYALVDADRTDLTQCRWSLMVNRYVARKAYGGGTSQTIYLHRAVVGLTLGDVRTADHINHDRLDNRSANLRILTHAENNQNTPARGGSSRHRGVSWNKANGAWEAFARHAGRKVRIGYFDDEMEAARAASAFRARNLPFSEDAAT